MSICPSQHAFLLGICLVVGVVLPTGGCALHAPMSRTLMLHDEGATRPAHRPHYGVGFTGTGTLSPTQFLREDAQRRFSVEGAIANDIDPANLDNRSLGLYGGYYSDTGFAVSATLGTAVGADATWRVSGRNYLTLSGSVGGAQAFWSHRALNNRFLAVAVGAGYRYERKFFDVETLFEGDAPSPIPTYEVLPVHSGGGTVAVVLRPGPEAPGVLLGHLYAGYAPAHRAPVVTIGVTTGIF